MNKIPTADEYIIINKTVIQKRIEELEKAILLCKPEQQLVKDLLEQELFLLKQILSQSTPLIPEIEKAFVAGENYQEAEEWHEDYEGEITQPTKQDYISNLKLYI